MDNTSLFVNKSIFINNSAKGERNDSTNVSKIISRGSGGTIFDTSSNSTVLINSSKFINNSFNNGGGVHINISDANITISNNALNNNHSIEIVVLYLILVIIATLLYLLMF